jgi:CheY-like chemotaxis protein
MVYGFAKQSDGQVVIDSAPGRGTTTTIYLPWCAAPAEPVAPPVPQLAGPAGSGERILIVDDEPVLRGLVAEILRERGYQVLDAGGGEDALALLRTDPGIDLLVTDVGMPVMNGRQLAEAARGFRPELKILFITGYVDNAVVAGGLPEPGLQILTKPFTRTALEQKIRAVLGERETKSGASSNPPH